MIAPPGSLSKALFLHSHVLPIIICISEHMKELFPVSGGKREGEKRYLKSKRNFSSKAYYGKTKAISITGTVQTSL